MKKLVCLGFAFLALSFYTLAQEVNFQKEINDQVWRPFIKTYSGLDTEGFMALHTPDVIRIGRDGERIRIGEEYAEDMLQNNEYNRKNNAQRSIEFRFLERLARREVGFEVGFYKVVVEREGEEPRTFYGKFHVVLENSGGRWKLAIDSDTSNKGQFTEADFQSGKKMEEWE